MPIVRKDRLLAAKRREWKSSFWC